MLQTTDRIECDKRIAYFLGWRIDNSFPDKNRVWRLGNNLELDTTFKFYTDYEVLMSVVEKIESLGFTVTIKESYVSIIPKENKMFNLVTGYLVEIDSVNVKEKRTAIYLAAAEFARRYIEVVKETI